MRARLKVVARTGDGGAVYLSSTADSSELLFAKPGQEVQREHFDGPVRSVKGNACVDFEAITRTRSSLITITDRGLLLHTYGFCSSCMEGSHDWELWPVCPNPLSAFNSLPGAERDEDRHDVVRTSEPVPEPEPVFTPVPAPEPEPEPVPSEPVEAAEGKKSRVRWLASRRAAAEVDASGVSQQRPKPAKESAPEPEPVDDALAAQVLRSMRPINGRNIVTASVDELVRRLSEDGVRIDEPFVAQALDQLVERGRVAHRPSYGYWILDEGAPPATVWESEPTNLDEIESRKWG